MENYAEQVAADLADATDAETIIRSLVIIRDLRQDLAQIATDLEARLAEAVSGKRVTVEGIGEVQIHRSTKRTGWRHDELLPAVLSRIMDEPATIFDRETGELLPYVQIGHNVTARLRECVGFGAGKVTGLRAIGLDPDEFCTVGENVVSVQLPPRAEA